MKIELRDIRKSFGDNVVLSGVSLPIDSGEVVAIAGENGAGKSTLMKILSGALPPDAGHILVDDRPVTFHGPQDAAAYRIRMIYQEMNLIRDLSVAENLYLVNEDGQYGRLFTNKKQMIADAREFLKNMGLDIDPSLPVARLNVAEQQMVEISKSLVKEARLLIMDEPTAALNREETDKLFEQIRHLKSLGVSVIYISHRLEEIFEIADRVVILRDGRVVLSESLHDVTNAQLVTAMVGKQLDNFYPKDHNAKNETVLAVRNLSGNSFHEISFAVRSGEILGIAGLMGSGKSEILKVLFGTSRAAAGEIRLNGAPLKIRQPADAIAQGIAFLTADRKQEGLVMDMSIYDNLSLVALRRFVNAFGYVRTKAERKIATEFNRQVQVKSKSLFAAVRHLSGGNQQKVVFGKWMMTDPHVFMMEEPTRGVDVGAKSEIYRLMNQLTAKGISIIVVSSDIPELVAMSDRIIVLHEGRVVKQLDGDDITQHNILHYSLRGEAE